jgi:hypothetical protein
MNHQQSLETLIKHLKMLNRQYTEPHKLNPTEYSMPPLYPAVTTYDIDMDFQVFIACIVDPDEALRATEWVNELAKEVMAKWAQQTGMDEPLEFDAMVWIGMEPPASALRDVSQWLADDKRRNWHEFPNHEGTWG